MTVDAVLAVRRAQEVVGLYGDPDTTWGIGLELGFEEPLPLAGAGGRLAHLVADHPHLGTAPTIERVPDGEWRPRTERSLSEPFGADGCLVRVLVDEPGTRMFVAAHHGVSDGLGLLAIAESVAQADLMPQARGIGDRSRRRSFLLSSLLRLFEALFRPPVRFLGTPSAGVSGHRIRCAHLPATRLGSSLCCLAVARLYDTWPGRTKPGRRRLLVLLGASRRPAGTVAPDRRTAFLRVPLDPRWSADEARTRFAAVDPEPDFPETSAGGIGPRVTHAMRNRLGGTAVVSNLGIVTGRGLRSVAILPALNGPHAVGLGVASTARSTTVTVHTRAGDFSAQETEDLLAGLVTQVQELAALPRA